jgi:signal transduction histidine kinase
MLDMTRVDSGEMQLHLENLDLRQLAVDQIERFRGLAPGRELRLITDGQPVFIRGDRKRISNVVANLLDNAIKYSRAGGAIECEVSRHDAQCFVAVRDQGPGIAPEDIRVLFNRFSRLPPHSTNGPKGLGLGLYLCREIAKRHGGDIVVTSSPSEGTDFRLNIPALEEEATAPA